MILNKMAKSLILGLPLLTLLACTSSNNTSKEGLSSGEYNATVTSETSGQNGLYHGMSLETLQTQHNIIYFGFDKYDISPEYAELLNAHASFLRNNPSYKITIEGHADERGTPEYNIALGERRANAVQMYLQGQGVSANQLSIVSYGKEKPTILGHDETAYAKNRRAVLVY